MLNDAALVLAANAVDTAIGFMQLNSGTAPGAAGTTGGVGTRVATNGTVDADGDITWTNIAFTGLAANQAVGSVTYWSTAGTGNPATGGTYYGFSLLGGGSDTAANAAGAYTVTSVTETGTAT